MSELNQLTPMQESVLIGSMLGDGNLNVPARGVNARFIVKRKLADQEYLRWEYDIFKDFCLKDPYVSHSFDKRTGKTYSGIYFYTKHLPIFTQYYSKWYNGRKIVPRDLKLDEYSLLVWFLDDGCVISNKNGRLDLQLSTDGFSREDSEFLADLLFKRYDARFSVNLAGRILAADYGTRKFLREIDPIFPEFMYRKSDKWRLITNIHDNSVKVFKSKKLFPVISREKILQVIDGFEGKTFSTKDIAEYLGLFRFVNGKKRYYYDIVRFHLDALVNDQKLLMIDPGIRKPKLFQKIKNN